jgi:hypothetical protein
MIGETGTEFYTHKALACPEDVEDIANESFKVSYLVSLTVKTTLLPLKTTLSS